MTDGRASKNGLRTYENIQKFTVGQVMITQLAVY